VAAPVATGPFIFCLTRGAKSLINIHNRALRVAKSDVRENPTMKNATKKKAPAKKKAAKKK
jgi:hypothetical protein